MLHRWSTAADRAVRLDRSRRTHRFTEQGPSVEPSLSSPFSHLAGFRVAGGVGRCACVNAPAFLHITAPPNQSLARIRNGKALYREVPNVYLAPRCPGSCRCDPLNFNVCPSSHFTMCNAWHHPINCRCGWGGEGHLGRSSGGVGAEDTPLSSYPAWVKAKYRSESTGYTVPNARCPHCLANVYFYQSPDGGRVFFDELGPPWPKHPCTDVDRRMPKALGSERMSPVAATASNTQRGYAWQQDEWAPFICDSLAIVPPGLCAAIGGLFNDAHIALFVTEKSLVVRAPYQLKGKDKSTFLLSTVQCQDGSFKVFKLIAYRHLADAIAAGRPPRPAPRQNPPRVKTEPRKALPRSMQTPPNLPPPQPRDVPTMTALQLAFARAKVASRGDS